ncbi:unnamed protein product [Fraxinus pennsylvanica]|uniref:Uncharacterized protein n=1 Tax=Fraxinus pennsylvanica TaxID=56036 RepID=A0AAD1YSQ3_9LAMI|nr:unnamed protein product [Fraxinus pennsylvanica]
MAISPSRLSSQMVPKTLPGSPEAVTLARWICRSYSHSDAPVNELLLLEEDVKALEEMYPQGEKAEASWAMSVLGYLAKLVLGVLGDVLVTFVCLMVLLLLIVSVAWIAHIVIYLLIDPPISAFLNEIFIKLDDVWGLLGTAAFAFFCFYLLLAVIAGAMMLGLKLVFITIHPMKYVYL